MGCRLTRTKVSDLLDGDGGGGGVMTSFVHTHTHTRWWTSSERLLCVREGFLDLSSLLCLLLKRDLVLTST